MLLLFLQAFLKASDSRGHGKIPRSLDQNLPHADTALNLSFWDVTPDQFQSLLRGSPHFIALRPQNREEVKSGAGLQCNESSPGSLPEGRERQPRTPPAGGGASLCPAHGDAGRAAETGLQS